jgi:hypothetical protein
MGVLSMCLQLLYEYRQRTDTANLTSVSYKHYWEKNFY